MKNIIKSLFLFSIIFISTVSISKAQALKVAFINTDELLISLPEVKAANDSLISDRTKLEKEIQSLILDLRTKATLLESKKNETAPIEYEKSVEALKAEQQKIAEKEETGRKFLEIKSQSYSKPLEAKVNAAIKEIAAAEGFAYVINSSQGMILYADENVNILEKVKAKLLASK
jgi:outer membrane protein